MNRLFATLAAAASIAAGAAQAQCVPLWTENVHRHAFTIGAGTIKTLFRVHERISTAADLWPVLVLCEATAPNATARPVAGYDGVVTIYTGLLRLTGDDADQIAAVVAHEFGHLLHRHGEQKVEYERLSRQAARQEYVRGARGSIDVKALESVVAGHRARTAAFSRDREREADDQGFALARAAGFAGQGAVTLAEKMKGASGAEGAAYFSTHPGWGERAAQSRRLERNDQYRLQAATALVEGKPAQLKAILATWRAEVPESAALSFYEGAAAKGREAAAQRLAKFEEAQARFAGLGMSRSSQGYQDEAQVVPLALCLEYYWAGRKTDALYCAQSLRTRADADEFKRLSGWSGFIWTGTIVQRPGSILFTGKDNGTVMLTNCAHTAEQEGLIRGAAGQPARAIEAQGRKPAHQVMQCSPDFCHCRAAAADAVPPEGWKVVSQPFE